MYQETEKIELKRELTDDVKKEIIAFLNASGGTIFVGVEDDGTVVGINDDKQKDTIDLKLGNWLQDAIAPTPLNLVTFKFNDDDVLEINVQEGNHKPYYLADKGLKPTSTYVRVGRSKRNATEEQIKRMLLRTFDFSYEENISKEQDLTFIEFARAFTDDGFPLNERSMVTLGIKNLDGQFTNLGYLFSDQSKLTVKIAEYDSAYNFKIKQAITGPLTKVIKDTQELAERLNDVHITFHEYKFKRIEKKSYPAPSLREMILNAFCHADYYVRSNIKVEFFPDKARIISPGGVFDGSLSDVLDGIQTYRNPKLVHVLDKLNFIENYGTGIPRTFESYEPFGVKPELKASDNFFFVYLPNLNAESGDPINDPQCVPQGVPQENAGQTLNIAHAFPQGVPQENAERILALIKSDNKISRDTIAKELNISKKTVGRYLKKMPNIKYVGSGYSGHWEIIE